MKSRDDIFAEKTENVSDFGRCFRYICQMLGITSLNSIAVRSKIPQPTLYQWANDDRRPHDVKMVEKLLDGFRTYEGWREEPWARDLTNFARHVTRQQYNQALADLAELEREVQQRTRTRPNVHE